MRRANPGRLASEGVLVGRWPGTYAYLASPLLVRACPHPLYFSFVAALACWPPACVPPARTARGTLLRQARRDHIPTTSRRRGRYCSQMAGGVVDGRSEARCCKRSKTRAPKLKPQPRETVPLGPPNQRKVLRAPSYKATVPEGRRSLRRSPRHGQ